MIDPNCHHICCKQDKGFHVTTHQQVSARKDDNITAHTGTLNMRKTNENRNFLKGKLAGPPAEHANDTH